jgi:hypothetical protein
MTILDEVLEKLEELSKALPNVGGMSSTSASMGVPTIKMAQTSIPPPKINIKPSVPTPKKPSATPMSRKDPIKVAQQVKNPTQKKIAMGQAKIKVQALKNPNAMNALSKAEDKDLFYAVDNNGERVSGEPHTKKYILDNYENAEHLSFIPIKQERIKFRDDGTWHFDMDEEDKK